MSSQYDTPPLCPFFLKGEEMPLTSVGEMKIILQVSGSSRDEQIKTLLPVVESFIQNYTHCSFETGSEFPDGLKLAAAHMIEYISYAQKKGNVTGESIGAYSVTYGSGYPQEIIDMLKPFRKVRFVPATEYEYNYREYDEAGNYDR